MHENWCFLLSQFQSLGGIAENVCQKDGEFGRGIFPVNPNLKSRIYIPSKLFINKDDIYLEDNKVRIQDEKQYSFEVIVFLIIIKITFLGAAEVKKQWNPLKRD